ncbi:MAG TPA: DUF3501 family protein [Chloroflexota bacterium]|nr:DUF3501 family protein [Chloroflexota bacterium]
MQPITRSEVRSLEDYEVLRADFRQHIRGVKEARRVVVGDAIALTFENRETALYQIQEMLRTERIFEPHRIQEEIDIYNELVPGANELVATLFIEIGDMAELRRRLPALVNVEHAVWLDVGPHRIHGRAEGGRSTEETTSTVHYLRFAVEPAAAAALRDASQPARLRIEHPHYQAAAGLSPATRQALADDLATP